jgi:uncharacterized membrane protein
MSKNRNVLILISIIITVAIFALSFYIDWIDNHYGQILNVMFIVLLIAFGIFNSRKYKNK